MTLPQHINCGIDLGTTNSLIALLEEAGPRVINNRDGSCITPSAVWIDPSNRLFVGDSARSRHDTDTENAALEFKLQMGLGDRAARTFPRSGRRFTPADLSAEILKSLRLTAEQDAGRDIPAAVITVPAAFDIVQCAATKQAAGQIGLADCPLVQEPIAAALAYGLDPSDNPHRHWLVYDLGGGTFDAAVVAVRGGGIHTESHEGDNELGGKKIDWDLVTEFMVPEILRSIQPEGFRQSNPAWRTTFAKLKHAAEEAKILVCTTAADTEVRVVDLFLDTPFSDYVFQKTLTVGQLCDLAKPHIDRSIYLCHRALASRDLKPKHLERILMVGGSSQNPWLREAVQDAFSIELAYHLDPMTVVACGAALYAGTCPIPKAALSTSKPQASPDADEEAPSDTIEVELDYSPVGTDCQPSVGGRVLLPESLSPQEFRLSIQEERLQWNSGEIALSDEGGFVTELFAQKGPTCVYQLTLTNAEGRSIPLRPSQFTYRVGPRVASIPLTHSIGVVMADGRVDRLIQRGAALPAEETQVHRTAHRIEAGQEDAILRIPIVEGESIARANRNLLIGQILVPSEQLKRNLPAGSDVEITVEISESRVLAARAFVPVLGERFEEVIRLDKELASVEQLKRELSQQRQRYEDLAPHASCSPLKTVREPWRQLGEEQWERRCAVVLEGLDGTDGDPESQQACHSRLREVQQRMDQIEDALEWPVLKDTAMSRIAQLNAWGEEHGERHGQPGDHMRLRSAIISANEAIRSEAPDLLRERNQELTGLLIEWEWRRPEFWVNLFGELCEYPLSQFTDRQLANDLLDQGRDAIQAGDSARLQSLVQQLFRVHADPDKADRPDKPDWIGSTTR